MNYFNFELKNSSQCCPIFEEDIIERCNLLSWARWEPYTMMLAFEIVQDHIYMNYLPAPPSELPLGGHLQNRSKQTENRMAAHSIQSILSACIAYQISSIVLSDSGDSIVRCVHIFTSTEYNRWVLINRMRITSQPPSSPLQLWWRRSCPESTASASPEMPWAGPWGPCDPRREPAIKMDYTYGDPRRFHTTLLTTATCVCVWERERNLEEAERTIALQDSSFDTVNLKGNFRRVHKLLLSGPFHGMDPSRISWQAKLMKTFPNPTPQRKDISSKREMDSPSQLQMRSYSPA